MWREAMNRLRDKVLMAISSLYSQQHFKGKPTDREGEYVYACVHKDIAIVFLSNCSKQTYFQQWKLGH